MRQRLGIVLAGVLHGIQRFAHGAVADRMHVHDPAALLGRGQQRAEALWIDQQLALLVAVGVRVDHRGGLPRIFEDAVDEHLEAGEGQVGHAFELAHHLGLHGEVLGLALRVGQQQGGHVHVQLALLGQLTVQRQHAEVAGGGAHLEQRLLAAAIGRGIHPGGDAHFQVQAYRLAGGLQHQFMGGLGQLAAHPVPAGFAEVAGGRQVRLVLDIAGFLGVQGLDQRGIDADAPQHGLVGPAGVAVDAVEHQRLLGPAALVEALGQRAAVLPVGRADAADDNDVFQARGAGRVLREDPLFQFRQRLDLVIEVGAQAGQGAHHRVAVGVDHARHQHLAGQVDALGAGVGQGEDGRVAADLENPAVVHGDGLGPGLAGLGGKHLAVIKHHIGGGHGFQGGKS